MRTFFKRAVLGGNGSNSGGNDGDDDDDDDDSHALGTLMRFDAKTGKSFVLLRICLGMSL